MLQPTINVQLVALREGKFWEFVREADEDDLIAQHNVLCEDLAKPEFRDIRTPTLELARERLGILKQTLGFV